MKDDRPFAIAGLWEQWRGGEGQDAHLLETCTIITTEANELSRPIHDRMPVILDIEDYGLWLDPDVQDRQHIEPLLRPCDSARMVVDPSAPTSTTFVTTMPSALPSSGNRFEPGNGIISKTAWSLPSVPGFAAWSPAAAASRCRFIATS